MRTFSPDEDKALRAALDRRAASAAAWLETNDGRLIIVKSDYKQYWSLPGGLIDAGETPLQAVRREVAEEIGIDLPAESFEFRMVISRVSSNLGMSYQFVFRATIADNLLDTTRLQEDEIKELAYVSREEVHHNDRNFAEAIYAWATNQTGYAEHRLP